MYYIDGNNLEGVIPEVQAGTVKAEQLVTGLVQIWARRTGKKVTLVFDGHRPDHPNVSGIIVVYPGNQDQNADDVLRRLILRDNNKGNSTLVTNDGELVRFARSQGVRHEYAREFVRVLEMTNREIKSEKAEQKPAAPKGAEVEEWMNYFGLRPGSNRRK